MQFWWDALDMTNEALWRSIFEFAPFLDEEEQLDEVDYVETDRKLCLRMINEALARDAGGC